jgi:hypothetical protein
MKRVLWFLALVVIFLGCAKVNYIGVSYPPTQQVDLYLSEYDVRTDYKVIGRIIATTRVTSGLFSDQEFQEKIMKKARGKGADGVIIIGFDHILAISHDVNSKVQVDSNISERR